VHSGPKGTCDIKWSHLCSSRGTLSYCTLSLCCSRGLFGSGTRSFPRLFSDACTCCVGRFRFASPRAAPDTTFTQLLKELYGRSRQLQCAARAFYRCLRGAKEGFAWFALAAARFGSCRRWGAIYHLITTAKRLDHRGSLVANYLSSTCQALAKYRTK